MRFLLDHLIPAGPVLVVGDDTVDGHPGPNVYGKARHRDPVRSSHTYTAWRYGHTWVVLAVLVQFPFATRPWALPVLSTGPANHVGENVWNRSCGNGCRLLIVVDQQARRMLRGECSARDGGRDGRVPRSIQQPAIR